MTDRLSLDSNDEINVLKKFISEKFTLTENLNNFIDDKVNFTITFNEIPAQDVMFEIEAALLNEKKQFSNEKEIMDLILKCVEMQVDKFNKIKKKKSSLVNNNKQSNRENFKNLISDSNNKHISLEYIETLNEKHHNIPMNCNSSDMIFNTASDSELKEYDIIPKDERTYFEEYKLYFNKFKEDFLKDLGLTKDDILLDKEKFILLVSFENSDEKISISGLVFVDPINDYKRYYPKFENADIMREYHFFSGQIVYVNGIVRNDELYVNQIELGMEIQTYNLQDNFVMSFYREASPYVVNVLNGPFFNKKEINFDLFLQTLRSIAGENPNALILSGPFISIDNSAFASGDIKQNPNDELSLNYYEFFEMMMQKINEIFISKKTLVIVCPSLQDIINYHPLPQPPFIISHMKNFSNIEMYKKKKLRLISNPQLFQLNEVYFGVANYDLLKDMISNSLIKDRTPKDSSLDMILRQRSFYPILPTTVSDDNDSKTITLDYKQLNKLYFRDIPDIIITPSSIQTTIKKVHSTYYINPGTLYKGNSIGSFAKITIFPPSGFSGLDIQSRIRIDICKITHKN